MEMKMSALFLPAFMSPDGKACCFSALIAAPDVGGNPFTQDSHYHCVPVLRAPSARRDFVSDLTT